MGFLFFLTLILLPPSSTNAAAAVTQGKTLGWAPTTAPKWYKNFPPWWISKVDDPGYKGNRPVTVVPIQPIRPAPPPSARGGHLPDQLPQKIVDQIKEGTKKYLDFPTESAEKITDDKNGNSPTESLSDSDGGQLFDSIVHANDHAVTRKGGKKSNALAVLEDPVFQNQSPDVQGMKEMLLIELQQQQQQQTQRRLRGGPAPPNAYNIGQKKLWVTENNQKALALKTRVGQQLPLWDPYWQKHRGQMPSFQSGSIANNAFLHYKNSPFDLLQQSQFGGPAGKGEKENEENASIKEKETHFASSFESDANW